MVRRIKNARSVKTSDTRRSAPSAPAPSPYTYNFDANASAGSATFGRGRRAGDGHWRATLLGAAAAGAMALGYGRSVGAQVIPPAAPCDTVAGGEVTCTGDVSAGVELINGAGPYTTLNVSGVTQDIAPAAGVDGVNFTSNGAVTINSDTTDGPGGPFAITATGASSDGIRARSTNDAVGVSSTDRKSVV